MRDRFVIGLVVALLVATAGCGSDDSAIPVGERAVDIEMRDNAFSPDTVTVPAGERVRFVFENVGEVDHEAIIGAEDFQDQHEEEMNPRTTGDDDGGPSSGTSGHEAGNDMDHGSTGAKGITVAPGDEGDLTRTFAAADDGILIGCHEPGHYDAGMVIKVSVA